ncbi:TolC family protein [Actinomadura barringtoniae]|uniref:TolC family protein n=1 Tax=Actinomadura barringtoniae TaxID=1427535 RepID=A0A939PMK2_9ACTN|nr:TolC family protein [Actinomadura barringtoniae]MBO2452654.1 TolC family protein [Actinomadura barringtoniae]
MDLASATRDLYGVIPAEFMARRKDLVQEARDSGDPALAKQLGALRRPTLSAWAVNLLSRSSAEELGWLLDVGADLRAAWVSGGHIGGLEQRRTELITLLVRTSRRLASDAGQPLRDPAVREVEETLQAATVDEDVAAEVREGHLAQARSHSGFVPTGFGTAGFGGIESGTALARSSAAPARAAAPAEAARTASVSDLDRKRTERARKRAEQAQAAKAERKAELDQARRELDEANKSLERAQRTLREAQSHQETAQRRLDKAEKAYDKALEAADEARRRAEGQY